MSPPAKIIVTLQDGQSYKNILLQSKAHRVHYRPTDRIRANKGDKYIQFISQLFSDTHKLQVTWKTLK